MKTETAGGLATVLNFLPKKELEMFPFYSRDLKQQHFSSYEKFPMKLLMSAL